MAQQTEGSGKSRPRKKRNKNAPPTWRQRLMMALSVWASTLFVWVLRLTCRIDIVQGKAHVDALIRERAVVVPCGWHQRIIVSGLFLRSLVPCGLRIGFLISPSREGEFIARVALAQGTETIRGSSSRTGKEAMAALTRAVRNGVSPMMYGDGPRGPAGVFKPGAVILAGRSGASMLLVGCAVSRYWQMGSWDSGQVPKPFSRMTIAVDEPWPVTALEGAQHAEDIAKRLGDRLNELDAVAEAAQKRSTPAR